jgi:polyisoprenoid-binding protein YceI
MTRVRSVCACAFAAAVALGLPAVAADPPAPLTPASIPAGHYVMDKRHTSLTVRVNHEHVSLTTLRFDRMDGAFDYDPAHPEAARLTASVDPTSLDVNGDWAKEFQERFLQASKFPQATFVSTGAQALGGAHGTLSGNLTLMGMTKPVTFDVVLVGSAVEQIAILPGHRAVGFEATTTIRRSDFGSTAFQGMVGDEVTLTFEAEFDKQ